MRFPIHIATDLAKSELERVVRREKRRPFVLMMEPLHTCNLACLGCSVERHTGKLSDRLSLEVCLEASDLCHAPSVSLCGGEPTLYPELPALIDGLITRKRHIYLCTNGLVLDTKVFGRIPPHKRLTINVHLDGMRDTHDRVCARHGVFDKAIAMIREAKRLGYRVNTNTTVFKETDMDELDELCRLLTDIGVDGMLIAPGYHYESVSHHEMFLSRKEAEAKFKRALEMAHKYPFNATPMFLEFAAGMREYPCSPWSTVTFTPKGWKKPCYLIGEGFTFDWEEFWYGTDWTYWESRKDPRCTNCKMHSGFEASALRDLPRHPGDIFRLALWNLRV